MYKASVLAIMQEPDEKARISCWMHAFLNLARSKLNIDSYTVNIKD